MVRIIKRNMITRNNVTTMSRNAGNTPTTTKVPGTAKPTPQVKTYTLPTTRPKPIRKKMF